MMKLSVDNCFYGNSMTFTTGGVFRNHQGFILVDFDLFLAHQSILFVELTTVCIGLEMLPSSAFLSLKWS